MQRFILPICLFVFVGSGVVVAWIYFAAAPGEQTGTIRASILLDLAKNFAQLAIIGVIGAFIKWLLENYDATKRERDAKVALRKDLWRGLRTVFGEVEKARDLIEGAKSALTYGTQLRHIMDQRLELGEIRHEVSLSQDTFTKQNKLRDHIKAMEDYLDRLIYEYRDKYLSLSQTQSRYEEEKKTGQPTIDMGAELDKLPVLKDLREASERREGDFTGSYHNDFRVNYFDARKAVLADILSKS